MRGDTGNDFFLGGQGYDIASFATSLPPGQPEVKDDGTDNPIDGVAIAFEGACNGGGCADGDGGNEQLGDIEEIVGSPFKDRIRAGGRRVQASFGADIVENAVDAGASAPTPVSTVFISAALIARADSSTSAWSRSAARATTTSRSTATATSSTWSVASALTPGEGCADGRRESRALRRRRLHRGAAPSRRTVSLRRRLGRRRSGHDSRSPATSRASSRRTSAAAAATITSSAATSRTCSSPA